MNTFGNNHNKYRNTKTIFAGKRFDSIKEMKRYIYLKGLEDKGEIKNLRCQVPYTLIPAVSHEETVTRIVRGKPKTETKTVTVQRAVIYKADFVYTKTDGTEVVEDVKASEYLLTKEYRLKEKLMLSVFGIRIRRVFSAGETI